MIQRYFNYAWKVFIVLTLFFSANLFMHGCMVVPIQNSIADYQGPTEYNIDELNQYGQWVVVPDYGDAWKPSVVSDWEPFHNGHWVNSDNNWTWISYEPFGWVVYHYGSWYDDPTYGWVWIPGNTGWSPAVVQWSQYDDYVSWAPLPPKGVTYGNPWEEKTRRHWHTVNANSFLNDDVGHLREVHPQVRGTGDNTVNNPPATPQNTGNTGAPPTTIRNNDGQRNVIRNSPSPVDLERRTGRKVVNTPVTKEPIKSPSTNLNRMNLPDSEKKRVEDHQQSVKKDVLVPKQNPNSQGKKDENKDNSKGGDNKR